MQRNKQRSDLQSDKKVATHDICSRRLGLIEAFINREAEVM